MSKLLTERCGWCRALRFSQEDAVLGRVAVLYSVNAKAQRRVELLAWANRYMLMGGVEVESEN